MEGWGESHRIFLLKQDSRRLECEVHTQRVAKTSLSICRARLLKVTRFPRCAGADPGLH